MESHRILAYVFISILFDVNTPNHDGSDEAKVIVAKGGYFTI